MSYYKLPIAFGYLTKGEKRLEITSAKLEEEQLLEVISLEESIKQYIGLLLLTCFGEYRYDPNLGSILQKGDFTIIKNIEDWKKGTKKEISNLIQAYEKRITEVKVDVNISKSNEEYTKDQKNIRKKIVLIIKGKIIETKKDFEFIQALYTDPLSFANSNSEA